MKGLHLVDSCGWLEYVAGSAQGKKYFQPINDTENLIVPTICLYEVLKRVMTQQGDEEALRVIAHMQQGKIVDFDSRLSIEAAQLRKAKHLPMADSIILATALALSATIWTQDGHFRGMKSVMFLG